MASKLPKNAIGVTMDKRILNEFASKILNEERLDMLNLSRKNNRLSAHAETQFHCECDDADCTETIAMSTEEYEKVHEKTRQFVVIPSHVRLDLEEIHASFRSYSLVSKYFPKAPKSIQKRPSND